eukprot:2442668-Rhodomonas_salina.1
MPHPLEVVNTTTTTQPPPSPPASPQHKPRSYSMVSVDLTHHHPTDPNTQHQPIYIVKRENHTNNPATNNTSRDSFSLSQFLDEMPIPPPPPSNYCPQCCNHCYANQHRLVLNALMLLLAALTVFGVWLVISLLKSQGEI